MCVCKPKLNISYLSLTFSLNDSTFFLTWHKTGQYIFSVKIPAPQVCLGLCQADKTQPAYLLNSASSITVDRCAPSILTDPKGSHHHCFRVSTTNHQTRKRWWYRCPTVIRLKTSESPFLFTFINSCFSS